MTRRALLLAGVGRATQHANQTTIHPTPMYASKMGLLELIANVRKALAYVRGKAQPLSSPYRWRLFLDYVVALIVPKLQYPKPAIAFAMSGELLFLDERKARFIAQRLGVPLIGSCAVLRALKRDGVIESVKPALAAWQGHGYFISKQLQGQTLKLAGE